jgi:hypothetical protein
MCKTNPMFFPFKGGDGDLEFFLNSKIFVPSQDDDDDDKQIQVFGLVWIPNVRRLKMKPKRTKLLQG